MEIRKPIETRVLLSSLWIFIPLNMLFRDIHELPTFIGELIDGFTVDERLLLAAAVALEIPILMVPLVHVLSRRVARVANLVVVVLWTPMLVVNNLSPDMDDVFFLAMQVIALVVIVVIAIRWRGIDAGAGTTGL